MSNNNKATGIITRNMGQLLQVLFIGIIGLIMPQIYLGNISVALISMVIVFLTAAYLMQRAISVFNIRNLTIPAFWYLTYLVMIYFPSFLVFSRQIGPSRYAYFFAVESVLITVPLGILFINALCRFKKSETNIFFTTPVQEGTPDIRTLIVYILFLCPAIFFTIVYILNLKTVPLFYMIHHPGEIYKLTVLREEAFKLFDPRWSSPESTNLFYVYLFLRTILYPFLIMVSLGYYFISRNKKWLFLFLITLFSGLFYSAVSIAKTPVAAILLRIAFLIYILRQGKFGKRMVVLFLILILLFPVVVTKIVYVNGKESLGIFERVATRLFYTPARDLYDYFYLFPYHHNYLYGQTLLKPFLILFKKDTFYIENYVYKERQYFPGVETGHANAAFQSNLHADFGIWGVLLGGFLIGMLIQGIQIHLLRKRKSILNIAVYSFMLYAFWVLNSGSITSVLFVNGVIPVLLLAFIFKALQNIDRAVLSRRS